MYTVEVELTTQCQAACPMCARNINGEMANPYVKTAYWTLDEFKTVFDNRFLQSISTINLCGAYGDPIINADIKEICNYLKDKFLHLEINTNGSIRNTDWWYELPKFLPTSHTVTFGVDGIGRNHELHRINTRYNKIVENIKSFVEGGGTAAIAFIEFEHNKDDYQLLMDYWKEYGVPVYHMYTNRFRNKDFTVLNSDGNTKHILSATNGSLSISPLDNSVSTFIEQSPNICASCNSHNKNILYIDAYKKLWPCCETATIPYMSPQIGEPNVNELIATMKQQFNNINIDDVLLTHPLDIVNEEWWNTWGEFLICKVVCGGWLNKDLQFL